MATDIGHGHDTGGQMDIREHVKAWKGFMSFVKWQILAIAIVLILLAIFRT